ncbi:hypothetical protein ACFL6E_04305 [Candidatus Neomarinimicrobiota bacterium]
MEQTGTSGGSEQLKVSEQEFKYIDSKTIDDKHRVSLGKKVQQMMSEMGLGDASTMNIYVNAEGHILMQPMVQIPANEAWIWKNAEVRKSFAQAFEDLQAGRTIVVDDIDKFVDQL